MSSSEEIKVTVVLKKEDLKCCICLSFLNKQIYKCVNGPHYVCGTCNQPLTSCPTCRHKDKLVRALDVESFVKPHLKPCVNAESGCKETIFEWDTEHKDQCSFHPLKCTICNRTVSSSTKSLISHYKEFCDTTFSILNKMTLDKPRFKMTFDHKPSLININGRYIIFIIPDAKRECYIINVVSENEIFVNQKIKCTVDDESVTNGANYTIKIPIKIIKNLNINKGTPVPYVTGNSLLFEDPILQMEQVNKTNNKHSDTGHLNDVNALLNAFGFQNNRGNESNLNHMFM